MKKLVIFDLDGTILDTISDLATSTNHALKQLGFPTHPEKDYHAMVGNGINKMFERALPEGQKTQENIMAVRQIFLPYYDGHKMLRTHPYLGVIGVMEKLEREGVKLAVASNKYQEAAELLVKHYFPQVTFVAILGEREGIPAKPDPEIVFEILKTSGVSKEDTLYVGDSPVDMQTAKSAGVEACGVAWGFSPKENLEACHPAYIIDKPDEIFGLVF